jgi:O-antigen/teichoic acid export membrane protein
VALLHVPLVDATMGEALVSVSGRARRLVEGWSANLFQLVLGVTQQVALIPVFLHFWTSDVLAAWLAIYAAGNLVMVADGGLQARALNRFFAFKASVDGDGRTASYYAAMLRIYVGLAGLLIALVLAGTQLLRPSELLGFRATPDFDTSFVVMIAGTLLTLPVNLASALYRARGRYSRAVWLQCAAMLIALLGQFVAIVATANLLAVTIAYVATQLLIQTYVVAIDARRLFPFLHGGRVRRSWRWIAGQFRRGFPFAIASGTELALQNLPMLLVSAFVIDRVAVAQWGLTRVVAGLLRALCTQATLPLAAELGHDHAIGDKARLQHLYARGSVFVTLLASAVISGLLPFWPDFFALWTHGAIPYDPVLTMTLLIGTGVIAPSILALGFANYSNRGELLARTKGLQLAVFLVLSIVLTPRMGPLGAAIAIVASDVLVQFGLLAAVIIGKTLRRPIRHVAFLGLLMALVTPAGWGLGTIIRSFAPGTGLGKFVFECMVWLMAVALLASPLASRALRDRLSAAIPR